ncbi:nickel/cobalt ABC transporter permease [Aliarcobacter vitoriensis]|uniref:nickel/cobalt ABC transporter permease n=1 Tax=Aliarcobacter vitoriensis TaxID=2011099 RepID=UPI003AAE4DA5
MIKKLLKDKLAIVSLSIIFLVIILGIFAPFVAINDPLEPNLANKFASYSLEYPLGTDHLGRCVFSRLIYGIHPTIFLAFLTMFITIFLGVIFGLIAGYFEKVENFILRVCDIMLSFPNELLIIAIVGILGVGIENIIIATIIAKFAWYTRMTYSFVLEYKNKNYVLFSKTIGIPSNKILRKHLLPSISSDIVVLATIDTGWVILSISALSFLGLGIQAPTPEWGMMLNEAKNMLSMEPSLMFPAGLSILIVVASFNFLGDSLRDAFDIKHNKRFDK